MSRIGATAAVTLAVPLLLVAAIASARAQSVSSDAYDIGATFTSGTMTTMLGPINDVSGAAPPAYASGSSIASYTGSVTLPPLVPGVHPIVANLDVTATNLRASVMSKGIQIDFISATGKASVGPATLNIVSDCGPCASSPVIEYLGITSKSVSASATYTLTFPSTPTVAGSASLAGVVIGGSLLGGQTVQFSGSPPPNTVLFQNANVTIVANEQIAPVTIVCGETCRVVPLSILVHPLAVHITNAFILHGNVTGEIDLGSALAS